MEDGQAQGEGGMKKKWNATKRGRREEGLGERADSDMPSELRGQGWGGSHRGDSQVSFPEAQVLGHQRTYFSSV